MWAFETFVVTHAQSTVNVHISTPICAPGGWVMPLPYHLVVLSGLTAQARLHHLGVDDDR